MKKTALSLMMIALAFTGLAQDEQVKKSKGPAAFYARFDLANRWNHAGGIYNSNGISASPISGTERYDVAAGTSTFDYKKATYGAGYGIDVGVGYMFNNHLGVDLGVNLGIAPKKNTFEYQQVTSMGTITQTENTFMKMPVYIMPSIVLSSGYDDPFQVYTRLGLAFPIGGRLMREFSAENGMTGDIYEEDEEYDFYMSKGLQGALGASYQVSDNFGIYGEIRGMSLTRFVKSSTITRAELNGIGELDQWDEEDIETEYSPNYFYDPVTQTATMPTPSPVLSLPSSNFGIAVGARMGFGSPVRTRPQPEGLKKALAPYVRASVGYNLAHAGDYYYGGSAPLSVSGNYNVTSGEISADYKKGSFSTGLSATIAGGYMFNRYWGAELGVNLGISPTTYTSTFNEAYPTGTVERTVETRAKMPIFLNPSLVFSTGNDKGINVYSRVGIALPFGGNLVRTYTETDNITNTTTTEEEEVQFAMSKGLTGALGLRYDINDALGLRAEVNGMSLTRYAKSSTITKYTINGSNELGTLNTAQRETEFQLNWTYDPANTNPAAPSKANAVGTPYSNFGFSLGAEFRF
jgi:hypothetical protein